MSINIYSDDDGETPLHEAWSDAARKASAAARGGRGQGLAVRKTLAAKAFKKAGGKRLPTRTPKGALKVQATKAVDRGLNSKIPKARQAAVAEEIGLLIRNQAQRQSGESGYRGQAAYSILMRTLTSKYRLTGAEARRFNAKHAMTDMMFSG